MRQDLGLKYFPLWILLMQENDSSWTYTAWWVMILQTRAANPDISQSSLCTTASHNQHIVRYSVPTLALVVLGLHLQSSFPGEQQSLGGQATVTVRPATFYLLLPTVSKTWYLLLFPVQVQECSLSSASCQQWKVSARPWQGQSLRKLLRLQAGKNSKCSSHRLGYTTPGSLTAQFRTLIRPILTVRIPITLPSVRHTLTTEAHKIGFGTCLLHCKGEKDSYLETRA